MAISSRKERDRQLRRADIFKAAEHLFAVKGYHKATIRDIAKEAQYAIGTVYLHFKDKEDLYFALLEEKIKSLFFTIKDKTSQTKEARKKLEILVHETLVFFENNQNFFQIFASEQSEVVAERKVMGSSIGVQMQEYVVGLIKYAQGQGIVSKDFKAGQLGDVLVSMLKTIGIKWLQEKDNKKESLADSSRVIIRLFLNGAANK
ncbi:MAG: TetR/AcrR family transcriptional regulator [Candidatus Omnitrophica bacterium]|jgi:AcrR family transcriptional regulator|nr:TetR/AcrR family transcriptional regulator [Candidatus Omnitrophota bacterium]